MVKLVKETTTEVPQQPGGTRYREAREQIGCSLAEVAEQLKVPAGYLDCLERECFDSLPGATFVRGYIRLYARFLRLEEEPLLACYTHYLTQQEKPPRKIIRIKKQLRVNDPIVKWSSVVILLLTLALSMLWWTKQQDATLNAGLPISVEVAG